MQITLPRHESGPPSRRQPRRASRRRARPAAGRASRTVRGPTTDWPPFSLFSQDDYPAAALRGSDQGTTRYRFEINPEGRVSRCTITASSGSTPLDRAACLIVTSRARFAPARDSAGRPVPDAREGDVTWRLEEE